MENAPPEENNSPELKKKKMDPVLFWVLVISGGIHAVAALIFGSMVMYEAMKVDEIIIKAEPKKQLPPKKIPLKRQPNKNSPPKPRKITVEKASKINIQKFELKMPYLSPKTDFTHISSIGVKTGLDYGGIDLPGTAISLLDLQAKGERFLFMVDASARTMNPIKGGFDAFDTIRTEIVKLMKVIPSSIVLIWDSLRVMAVMGT